MFEETNEVIRNHTSKWSKEQKWPKTLIYKIFYV